MGNLKYILIIAFLITGNTLAKNNRHNYIPKEGYVLDEKTAIKIAEAVWLPIYGKRIYEKKPFIARLYGEIWMVHGSLPLQTLGGVPIAEISKKTGEILRVSHDK